MNLKRFFAKDMRSALQEIKEELGSEAIIMSSKNVSGGMEIVAAVDDSARNETEKPAPDTSGYEREIPDDSVNLSSSSLPEKRRSGGKNVNKSSDLTQRQEKFADSLAALLSRQEKLNPKPAAPDRPRSGAAGDSAGYSRTPPGSIGSGNAFKGYQPSRGAGDGAGGKDAGRIPENKILSDAGKLTDLSREVEAIRHLLQYQLAGLMHEERSREEPVRAMIARLLVSGGFSEKTADRVTNRINGSAPLSQAWRELARILENNVRVSQDAILKNGGAVALIGPTGVGKTTTIAKLAARFALEYGPDQVALISTDNYRIGASEQLQTYGRIMGCAVKVVEDVTTLSEALYQLRNRSLVLIDTAGLGQRDTRLEEELLELDRNARIRLQHYLVLPGTAQRKVLDDACRRFGQVGIDGLIITKLDESVSIGDALSIGIEQDIPIAYTTSGQRVPEDLEVGDSRRLVAMLLSQIEDLEPELELGAADEREATWARDLGKGAG